MKKRFLSTLLALCMVLALLPVSAFADEAEGSEGTEGTENAEVTIIASGECGAEGDNVTWTLDSAGTLTLSGAGATADYHSLNNAPWHDVYMDTRNITAIIVEDGITYMGVNVLGDGNPSIITIPASVTDLSILNLYSNQLLEFKVAEDNKHFCSVDGVLFTKDKTKLIYYPCAKLDRHYDIPDGVTVIGMFAFARADNGPQYLSSVTIPNSVEIIDAWAFRGCGNLTDVTLPTNLRTLGGCAFEYCGLERAVTIPASVSVIENSPFGYCTKLSDIIVETDNPYYCSIDGVLFNKNGSRLIEYPIGKTNTTYIVPDSVYWINEFAFCGSSLVSVDLPDSVTTIGQSGFGSCQALESIRIPTKMTHIAVSTFWSCKALSSVTIPVSVTSIGAGAFGYCKALADVYYLGSEEKWNDISIGNREEDGSGNRPLIDATLHCIEEYTVSYAANGGDGTMDSILVEVGESYTLPVCTFTAPMGKEFKAWSIGGVKYAPGDDYDVIDDTTVTAVWKDIEAEPDNPDNPDPDEPNNPAVGYTLTGTITGHQGVAYTSVTAKLVGLDGTEYPADVTGGESLDGTVKKECTYSVSAPAGQYNLEVEAVTEDGGVVNRSAFVKLTGNGQTKNINLPNGQAKVKVENNVETAVLVGGLDELIINADGEVTGEVTLMVDSVDNSDPGMAAIQSATAGQTLEFVEFSIQKTVDGTTTDVTDTGDTLIEIVLPFDSTDKTNVKVYRYHNEAVETLTEQAVDGEKIEVGENSITIYARNSLCMP